jgi:hypothetical protein
MNLDILFYSLNIIYIDHQEMTKLLIYNYNKFNEKEIKKSPIFSINKVLKRYYSSKSLEESNRLLEKLDKFIKISNYWLLKKLN